MMNFRKWDIMVVEKQHLKDPLFEELLDLCSAYQKPIYAYVEDAWEQTEIQNQELANYLGEIIIGEKMLRKLAETKRLCILGNDASNNLISYEWTDSLNELLLRKHRYDRNHQAMAAALFIFGVLVMVVGMEYIDSLVLFFIGLFILLVAIFLPAFYGCKGTASLLLSIFDIG